METIRKSITTNLHNQNKKQTAQIILILLIVATLVYYVNMPILDTKARTFDDDQYLFSNQLVKNPSIDSAYRFMTEVLHPSTVAGYYQPLSMISLMVDYAIAGSDQNMQVFHRTSLILHVLNSLIIVIILVLLFEKPIIAGLTGILFGVHPMVVETIAWIGERKTTLAAFFGLLCILLYVIHKMKGIRWLYYLACLMYVLSLLAKPTGTTIPIALILMDFWPLKNASTLKDLLESIKSKALIIAITVVSGVVTYISQSATAGVKGYGILGTFYKFCYEVVFYIKKMFYPTEMSVFYPLPLPFSINNSGILIGIVGTTILTIAVLLTLRKTRAVAGGMAIFFTLLLPAMGLIGFSNVIASDKYAYLPSIGILMLISCILVALMQNSGKHTKYVALAIVVAMLSSGLLLSRVTRNYITLWKDTEKLYKYMLAKNPEAPSLYYDLGLDYMRRGINNEARDNFLNSVKYDNQNFRGFTNLGIVYYNMGEVEKALESFNNALKANQQDYLAYENISLALISKNDYQGALDTIKKCIDNVPEYYKGYKIMGDAYMGLDQKEKAIEAFKKAIEITPGYEDAYLKLAKAYAKSGNKEEAKKTFITININNPQNLEAIKGMERIHFAEKRKIDIKLLFPD